MSGTEKERRGKKGVYKFFEDLPTPEGFETCLPTSSELDEMSLSQFYVWSKDIFNEIHERRIQRDPLSHLKKRISKILNDESLSGIPKEEAVYRAIKSYHKGIN